MKLKIKSSSNAKMRKNSILVVFILVFSSFQIAFFNVTARASPTPVLTQLTFKTGDSNPMYYPVWTRSTPYQILFCPWYESGMKLIDPSTLSSHFLPNGMVYDGPADYTKDGSKIVFSRYYSTLGTDTGFFDHIYTMNADGSDVKQLEDSQCLNQGAAWSPDSSKIAFTEISENPSQTVINSMKIYLIDSDGSGLTYLIDGSGPRWSADGQYLYYSRTSNYNDPDAVYYVYRINLTTMAEQQISTGQFSDISVNGKIVYNVNGDAYMMNTDGTDKQFLITSAREVMWSPDGTYITFVDDTRSGQQEVYTYGPISTSSSAFSGQGQSSDLLTLPTVPYIHPPYQLADSSQSLAQLTSLSSQTIDAAPGQTISLTLTYKIAAVANPNEVDQLFFVESWTPSWPPNGYTIPLYNGEPGTSPGISDTKTVSFTTPNQSGTYYLWFCFDNQYNIQDAVNQRTVSMTGLPGDVKIVVSGSNSLPDLSSSSVDQQNGMWPFYGIVALVIVVVILGFTILHYRSKVSTPKKVAAPPKKILEKQLICPNCGASLPTDSRFCGKCGASLDGKKD